MSEEIRLVDLITEPVPVKENKQLFENNSNAQQLAAEYLQMDGAFHNAKTPNLVIEHEKAQHRVVLLLKLQGLSNRKIAERVGMTESWISQVTRQPWFHKELTEQLNQRGEVFEELVEGELINSFHKLVTLRDTSKSEMIVRDCALAIIERGKGKPLQKTESHTTSNVFHVSAKLEDIDRQIQEVQQEEDRLLNRGTKPLVLANGSSERESGT